MKYENIIISDLHLGSDICKCKEILTFLKDVRDNGTKQLILNGDVFDSLDFRRLKKNHWKILSYLRKISDDLEVVWVNGNHDGPSEIVSYLLGTSIKDHHIFQSGNEKILCIHGHQFDNFIVRYPILTHLADKFYRVLMKVDSSFTLAHKVKTSSKTFLRNAKKIMEGSINLRDKLACNKVCVGHVHLAVANHELNYYNSGSWTDQCHYLSVNDGLCKLHKFEG